MYVCPYDILQSDFYQISQLGSLYGIGVCTVIEYINVYISLALK